jgi:type I restriction enzyme S subunit
VGEKKLVPVSISAGIGFVPQTEKFGRDISGEQYKLYTLVRDGDFVYNKGNSLKFPEGCIYLLQGWGEVAAPNVFICFRLKAGFSNGFFQACFEANQHGKQLKKHITSGARSNGLLNISKEVFFDVEVPAPKSAEQRKIADCLGSLEELIAAQAREVDLAKAHRAKLLSTLFPRDGETQPRLRFPQFRDGPAWTAGALGSIFETTSGGTPDRSRPSFWSADIPWITTSLVDFGVITEAEEFISEEGLKNSSAKLLPRGTVLMAMYGQGKTRGQVALLGIEAATNQACAAILPKAGIDPRFVFQNLASRYDELRKLSNSGGQENLSQGLIRALPFAYPEDECEQRLIVDCLFALEAFVAAERQKLRALQAHKRGLLQQLFPTAMEV